MKVYANTSTLGNMLYFKKIQVNIIVCKRLPVHSFMHTYFIFIVFISLKFYVIRII